MTNESNADRTLSPQRDRLNKFQKLVPESISSIIRPHVSILNAHVILRESFDSRLIILGRSSERWTKRRSMINEYSCGGEVTSPLRCPPFRSKNNPSTMIDEFVMMPDHMHGILLLRKRNLLGALYTVGAQSLVGI